MKIAFEFDNEYFQTIRSLGQMGARIHAACNVGLEKGCKVAAGNVVANHLTGQDLKRRTGNLANSVDGWRERDLEGTIGIRENSLVKDYAYLLGDEEKLITPKNAKYLAIPIGEALTPSGVPRYSSPREVDDGFFVKTGGRLLFGRKNGKRGRFRPLFTLVKSVLVQGTGALYDGVMESIDDITDSMSNQIAKAVAE